MASVTIATSPIPRTELAKYFADNPRLVRLLETLAHDITVNIPDVINPDTNTLNDVQEALGTVFARVHSLAARVAALEQIVQQLSEGPKA